jgi:hypothetical protein
MKKVLNIYEANISSLFISSINGETKYANVFYMVIFAHTLIFMSKSSSTYTVEHHSELHFIGWLLPLSANVRLIKVKWSIVLWPTHIKGKKKPIF